MSSVAVRLVVVEKDGAAPTAMSPGDAIEFHVERSKPIVIGRAPGNDVVVSAPSVGRRVVQISFPQEGLWVEDLGSGGGSALEVDGVRTERPGCRCPDQAVLWIGGVGFRVEFRV